VFARFQGPSVLQGSCTYITTWLESVQLPSTCLAWTIQSPSKVVAVPPLDQLCARGRVARTRVSLPPLPVPSFVVCFLLLVPFRTPSSVRPPVLSKSHALFLSSVDMLYLLTILSSSAISAAVDPASGEEALILAASLRSSLSSSLAKYSLCPCVCLQGQHLSLSLLTCSSCSFVSQSFAAHALLLLFRGRRRWCPSTFDAASWRSSTRSWHVPWPCFRPQARVCLPSFPSEARWTRSTSQTRAKCTRDGRGSDLIRSEAHHQQLHNEFHNGVGTEGESSFPLPGGWEGDVGFGNSLSLSFNFCLARSDCDVVGNRLAMCLLLQR